ncbi:MAG TPA: DsbA family protein [Burkholderiaceae bacterium]|nr:DsbA family protein [Burkholderiaceae bacterium]
MSTTILHYIYDPLCGWCYGAAPLVAAARQVVTVRAHGGGMMAGPNRKAVTPQLRAFVAEHDQRIARSTAQAFGDGYLNGLLRDTSAVLDSEPPIAAILAADDLDSRGLDMLARLQVAHYVEGRRIADRLVLVELATELRLPREPFEQALYRAEGAATQRHIAESRALLAQLGGHGFPTFALERDGRFDLVAMGQYVARPQQWQDWLKAQVPVTDSSEAGMEFGCSPDGCVIPVK